MKQIRPENLPWVKVKFSKLGLLWSYLCLKCPTDPRDMGLEPFLGNPLSSLSLEGSFVSGCLRSTAVNYLRSQRQEQGSQSPMLTLPFSTELRWHRLLDNLHTPLTVTCVLIVVSTVNLCCKPGDSLFGPFNPP